MITDQTGIPQLHFPLSPIQILHIDKLTNLERSITNELPLVDLKVEHLFAPGVYLRKMYIPKGTVATGKIHKTSHLTVISKGCLSFIDETSMQILQEGTHFLSQAGTKRAVYAHADTILTTIHPTTETNVEKLEQLLVADSIESYLLSTTHKEKLCHSAQSQEQ